ncbi:ABC transporter ATP-binding protein [Paucibacter sp. JuS9]|uniref:ABC transporter ATP-binding protein n=1 Tax=Paucibacter sp. JuS9 TaxID=3228748 RepID=UPI0037564E41
MAHILVSLDEVDLRYPLRGGGELRVLNRLTLDVPEGGFTAVLGPSGCGKSSLLRIIAGLVQPTHGRRIASARLDDALAVGMNFQRPVLLPWLTVRENALLPYTAAEREVPSAALERLDELIAVAGLQGFDDALPAELSGGMQMRASLIRTFVPAPQLVLMDEPFGALDEPTRLRLGIELRRLANASSCAVVFVTHNTQEAIFLADRVVMLSARPAVVVDAFDVPFGPDRYEGLYDHPTLSALCQRLRLQADYA